jgi:hypothetical protein
VLLGVFLRLYVESRTRRNLSRVNPVDMLTEGVSAQLVPAKSTKDYKGGSKTGIYCTNDWRVEPPVTGMKEWQ